MGRQGNSAISILNSVYLHVFTYFKKINFVNQLKVKSCSLWGGGLEDTKILYNY